MTFLRVQAILYYMNVEKLEINFGDRVEQLLNEQGIKPGDFYKDIGIVPQAFYDWKKKDQIPYTTTALKVARYFGVTVEWLVTGEEDTPEQKRNKELHERLQQIAAYAAELASKP